MKRLLSISIFALSCSLLIVSCGTKKNATRKCDGKKGTRTPMGLM